MSGTALAGGKLTVVNGRNSRWRNCQDYFCFQGSRALVWELLVPLAEDFLWREVLQSLSKRCLLAPACQDVLVDRSGCSVFGEGFPCSRLSTQRLPYVDLLSLLSVQSLQAVVVSQSVMILRSWNAALKRAATNISFWLFYLIINSPGFLYRVHLSR